MRNTVLRSVALWLLAALLIGCTAPTATPLPPTAGIGVPSPQDGYPVPSPVNTPESYPSRVTQPVPTLLPGEAAFHIDKPLVVGATQVTGSGTPGVPLILYNVTFMGEVFGQATVDESGRFAFNVPPLEENVRVGIGLDDLTGTRWSADYFLATGFRGSEALSLPNVGYFLDTAQVEAP